MAASPSAPAAAAHQQKGQDRRNPNRQQNAHSQSSPTTFQGTMRRYWLPNRVFRLHMSIFLSNTPLLASQSSALLAIPIGEQIRPLGSVIALCSCIAEMGCPPLADVVSYSAIPLICAYSPGPQSCFLFFREAIEATAVPLAPVLRCCSSTLWPAALRPGSTLRPDNKPRVRREGKSRCRNPAKHRLRSAFPVSRLLRPPLSMAFCTSPSRRRKRDQ